MNNCYGKNNDMQQRLITVRPTIGDMFQILICVPDTDDNDEIDEYLENWIEANTKDTVDDYDINETNYPLFNHISTLTDCFENEYEIYCDNPCLPVKDYFNIPTTHITVVEIDYSRNSLAYDKTAIVEIQETYENTSDYILAAINKIKQVLGTNDIHASRAHIMDKNDIMYIKA